MTPRKLAIVAGVSYLVIFFTAIYANFFVLEALIQDPVATVENSGMQVRLGALAFLIAAVFDVFVAWALYELYKGHVLTSASTFFRIMHATIMGVAVFALPPTLTMTAGEDILTQVALFNTMWLIGLFFFGVHLILLSRIVKAIRIIPYLLMLAGAMYIVDTGAHLLLPDYDAYAAVFLTLVAIPFVLGEMSFALWLFFRGGKDSAAIA